MADVTLPNITNLTDEVKGAGIGGTITYPVMAHFDDMTTTFRFHTITQQAVNLLRQDCMHIEARAGVQYHDQAHARLSSEPGASSCRCFRARSTSENSTSERRKSSARWTSPISRAFATGRVFEIDQVQSDLQGARS